MLFTLACYWPPAARGELEALAALLFLCFLLSLQLLLMCFPIGLHILMLVSSADSRNATCGQIEQHSCWYNPVRRGPLPTQRQPLVRVPGSPSNGQWTSALVEAVDLYVFCLLLVLPLLPLPLPLLRRRRQDQRITWCGACSYPSLVELAAGVTTPLSELDGVSIARIVNSHTPANSTGKPGAFSEFVKCYSCCRVPDDSPCEEGGTAGRCPPTTAAGLADLHEMGNCFHVPREEIGVLPSMPSDRSTEEAFSIAL